MGEAFHLIVGDGEKYAVAFVNIHTAKSVRILSSFLITCRSDTKLYQVKSFVDNAFLFNECFQGNKNLNDSLENCCNELERKVNKF